MTDAVAAPLFLAQPRFSEAVEIALHQLGRLIGNIGPDPRQRELRLLAAYRGQKRPGLVDAPGLCQAGAQQTPRPLETWTQSLGFQRTLDGFGISSSSVVGDRDGSEKQRHLRIERTEPNGLFPVLDGLAIAPGERQTAAEMQNGPPPNSD